MVEVGQPAPDFTLKSHENEDITLSQLKGKKWVIIHLFPAAFTGG
jgi:peroxiredoxin